MLTTSSSSTSSPSSLLSSSSQNVQLYMTKWEIHLISTSENKLKIIFGSLILLFIHLTSRRRQCSTMLLRNDVHDMTIINWILWKSISIHSFIHSIYQSVNARRIQQLSSYDLMLF